MRWSRRTSAKTLLAGTGVAIAVASGTGVATAINFYPPVTPPPIIIVFPPITGGGGTTIVQPGQTIYAPQLPAGAARPLIGPGMYPVQSPTGAAPLATTVAENSFQLAGMVMLALGVAGCAVRRRQLVPA